jgi:phosphoribosyl-AMP cyclohydrolase
MNGIATPTPPPPTPGGPTPAGPASAALADAVLAAVGFDANGLVPAIAQQHDTGEVLMMAWMNAEAIRETLVTGRVCYFSRSRGRLWRKGESSGQIQHLHELRVDCDGDTLLLLVQQDGVACHTGRRNCFFRAARDGGLVEIAAPEVSPEALYGHAHG